MRLVRALLTGLCVCLLFTLTQAGISASFYGGWVGTQDTDLRWRQADGTALTFHDVAWEDESFEFPIYYGVKLGIEFPRHPRWGLALEFTHAKMIADLGQTVRVDGVQEGLPVHGSQVLGTTFQSLEMSHGHNLLTLCGEARWPLDREGSSFVAALQPYLGMGAGIAIPHVEVATAEVAVSEYQWTGPAWQGFAGVRANLGARLGFFLEYKATWARLAAELPAAGALDLSPWAHHLVAGFNWRQVAEGD